MEMEKMLNIAMRVQYLNECGEMVCKYRLLSILIIFRDDLSTTQHNTVCSHAVFALFTIFI